MGLRCLLFSSDKGMVQPIWQALAELGIEGEYCGGAVDAVERVTTQLFQIVITDWEDQPEAAFLLKTARDLKAAQRPLTLAIVKDDAKLPEALQAGANSVLSKPIRAEQVLDTLRTACELLRAKEQPSKPQASGKALAPPPALPAKAVLGGAAAPAPAPAAAPLPNFVTQSPEKTFRAGEFLQSSSPKPGAQFDTEADVKEALDEVRTDEVDALTDLAPTAASVKEAGDSPTPAHPQESLTGWAALQARLSKTPKAPAKSASPSGELLSYGDTPSYGGSNAGVAAGRARTESHSSEPHSEDHSVKDLTRDLLAKDQSNQDFSNQDFSNAEFSAVDPSKPQDCRQALSEGNCSGDCPAQENEAAVTTNPGSRRFRLLALIAFAGVCLATGATSRGRQISVRVYWTTALAITNWLNPPSHLPQTVVEHESFRQSGDEYKLPATGTIPDATSDASQIRVLPVVDPTAKPDKTGAANNGQAANNEQAASNVGNSVADQNPSGQNSSTADPAISSNAEKTGVQDVPASPTSAPVASFPASSQGSPSGSPSAPPAAVSAPPANVPTASVHSYTPPLTSSPNNGAIPSSLKSQIASMTPEASGTKPEEAAMSSIEPVNLPESAVRALLAQTVEPEYPAAAKTSGEGGSVELQVLIGRDGAVLDAKFIQGSLVFARAAIDAVKQWRFKPYSMNGRPVSVSSTITLNFKRPL